MLSEAVFVNPINFILIVLLKILVSVGILATQIILNKV